MIGGCEVKGFAADTAAATTPIRAHSCGLKLVRPALTHCYPRSFTFYVGNPFPPFVVKVLHEAENEGTLRAFRQADRFPTFKIFRRPDAVRSLTNQLRCFRSRFGHSN